MAEKQVRKKSATLSLRSKKPLRAPFPRLVRGNAFPSTLICKVEWNGGPPNMLSKMLFCSAFACTHSGRSKGDRPGAN
jgi:hypothetical protein